jgi:hypothetical protein
MNENGFTGLMSAVCMALMFGLMWAGDATPAAFALVGLGAAVTVAVCALSVGQ